MPANPLTSAVSFLPSKVDLTWNFTKRMSHLFLWRQVQGKPLGPSHPKGACAKALLSGWKGNHLLKLQIGKFRWWTTPISSCISQHYDMPGLTANRTLPPSPATYFCFKRTSLSNEQVCWETITSSGTCCMALVFWQHVPAGGGGTSLLNF